ncbi:MAG: ABC transporter ATP-binding protein [Flexilinea sp.]|nr:ABC transporter ATP-binding protein [Flexilinea sp.]
MYLSLNHVTKTFPARGGAGEVNAVHDVNIEIQKGELVTLLGPSGCGKTTTLRLVAGFEFPTSGDIILDGKVINNVPTHKRDMSMVFQSYAIFPHLNVYENIAYGLHVQKVGKDEIKTRIDRVLDMVHLEGYETRAPNQLSGGQQQRVALARALVMNPKVLLMDEPLSNLDTKLREKMRFEIRQLQRELGFTSLYVTHDQLEAMVLSDKVVIMNGGKLEQFGKPREIYRYPGSRFVADFIGRANFLEAKVIEAKNGDMKISVFDKIISLNDPYYSNFSAGEKIDLVVRPEMVNVRRDAGKFDGKVVTASYLGESIEYVIDLYGTHITARETDPARMDIIQEGTPVKVDFVENCLHVLKI